MTRVLVLILSIICMISSQIYALPPYAQDHKDRLESIYKKQVFFNAQNQPVVSVAIAEHQKEAWIRIDGGVQVFLSGSSANVMKWDHPSVWKISLDLEKPMKPAKTEVCVILDQIKNHQRQAQVALWEQKLNQNLRVLEAGSVVGLTGKILDSKQLLICKCGFKDDTEARKEADILGEKLEKHLELITELVEYPTGHLIAVEQGSGIEVRSEDLIWFAPLKGIVTIENIETTQPSKKIISRSYEGDMYFSIGSDGLLTTVNEIEAEALLEGVVPSESYISAPLDALKAQAIAARGHLIAKAGSRHRSDPFLFCAQVHCQAYTGIEKKHDITDQAVQETQGLLLFDQDQELVDSVYSSTCGGHTESYHLMWGGNIKRSLLGKKDQHSDQAQSQGLNDFDEIKKFIENPSSQSFCKHPAHTFRWKEKISGKVLSKNINLKANIGPVYGIEVLKRGVSGRVIDVKYHGSKGSHLIRGSYLNRMLMGHLKSGLWIAKVQYAKQKPQLFPTDRYDEDDLKKQEPSFWIFEGAGYGHGVGMCQHGAIEMSKKGMSYEQILGHYYGDAKVSKIW